MRWTLLACVAIGLGTAWGSGAAAMAADEPEQIVLWPNGAPGKAGDEELDMVRLTVLAPPQDKATGSAMVVCPGGGYGALAWDHEGHQVGKWLNSLGVTAFVLKYRLAPRYRHPSPMLDVQRALRTVRHSAEKYKLAPHRVGVMGFSAGGHLASTAATHFDLGKADAADPVDRQSCRPDFAILCYPVISMTESFGHSGSRTNLLGKDAPDDLATLMSNEKQVTKDTPPTFLFHTAEDTGVPPENSMAFYAAMRKQGVPGELHIYQTGPHGVGLAPGDPVLSTWPALAGAWMRNSGFLADVKRAEVHGDLKVNGEPLKWGQVTFVPSDSAAKPVVMAMVRNGKFSLPAQKGPVLGPQRVEVRTMGDVVPRATVADSKVVQPKSGPASVVIVEGKNELSLELAD